MVNGWTRSICDPCWVIMEGARIPHRLLAEREELACVGCGKLNNSGIYIRVNPKTAKRHQSARYKDGIRGLQHKSREDDE